MRALIPHFILDHAARSQLTGQFEAASLFVDISGFTTLTEQLMQHGQAGAEQLAQVMEAVFEPLVQSVYARAGFITHFAGDGFTAVFPAERQHALPLEACLHTALAMHHHIARHARQTTGHGDFTFSIKIGIGAGAVHWGISRSPDQTRATYYFHGPAMEGSAQAEAQALGGEIVLAEGVCAARPAWPVQALSNGWWRYLSEVDGSEAAVPEADAATVNTAEAAAPALVPFLPAALLGQVPRGEFRQVVSVFIGLQLIPNHPLLALIAQAIFNLQRQYGGFWNGIHFGDKGCSVLLLWGAPTSLEKDLTRALDFVLALRAALPVPVRVGITYRLAYAGLIGSPERGDYSCYGLGVNLAARLMMAADWDDVWLDGDVAGRVEAPYQLEYIGERQFKGFREARPVYVLRQRQTLNLSARLYDGPLVGRAAELEALRAFLRPLWTGRFAGWLTVLGEVGVGKSRLVHEFAQRLHDELPLNAAPLWWLAQTDEILRPSLGPFRYALRDYFEQQPTASEADNQARFEARLNQLLTALTDPILRREVKRTQSFLGALVGLYWPASLYETVDPKLRFENTLSALINLLLAESQRQPMVIHLEDAHWLDEDSCAFLAQLGRVLSNLPHQRYPIAFLATARAAPPLLFETPGWQTALALTVLAPEAVTALAAQVLQADIAPELTQLLMERADGNPFFIEQIVRYLQESQWLKTTSAGLAPDVQGNVLPADARAVLVARLDRLTPELKHVAQTAAVLGREFDGRILARMVPQPTALAAHLAEGEQQGLWLTRAPQRYFFQHRLLRDAAYDMQLLAQRRDLHTAALAALETLVAHDDSPPNYDELAYHAEQSGQRAKQLVYYRQAGETAQAQYQNQPALTYYRQLAALLTDPLEKAQIDFKRAEVFDVVGQWDEALGLYQKTMSWAAQAGEADLEAACALALGRLLATRGDPAAFDHLERAHGASALRPDPVGMARALIEIGWVFMNEQRLAEAEVYLNDSLALVRAIPAATPMASATEALALNVLGNIYLRQKKNEAALGCYQASLTMRRALHDRRGVANSLNNLGLVLVDKEDFEAGKALHAESLLIQREIGFKVGIGSSLNNLAFVATLQNQSEVALPLYQESLRLWQEMNNTRGLALTHNNLGLTEFKLGHWQEARDHFTENWTLAQSLRDVGGSANALNNLGLVASELGDYGRAHGLFQQSLHEQPAESERGVLYSLIGLAGNAVRQLAAPAAVPELTLTWAKAGALFAFVEAWRATFTEPLDGMYVEWHEHTRVLARAVLSEAGWQAAQHSAEQLTLTQVLHDWVGQ